MGTVTPSDHCDIVVIGAGIVGAAVAARLAQSGRQVAVLDAQQVAGGATGRSAGMAVAGMPSHYQWAVENLGRERARAIWKLTTEGRDQLVNTAMRLGVTIEQPGSYALAVTEQEAAALETSAGLLQEDGFEAQFSATDPLSRGFLGALYQPRDAAVDAADLTRALLGSTPIAVHTNTEVHDLEQEGESIRVWAQGRTVRCRLVVLAVDGYTSLLQPSLAQQVAPGRALLLTTEPLVEQPLSAICHADYGYEYICPLPDGRISLGAWRRPQPDADEDSLREGLSRFTYRYFPEIADRISARRAGVIGFTPDGLPIIGHLPHLPQVTYAVGLGGRGLCWAFAVARRLSEWILDGISPGILSIDRLTGKSGMPRF